MLRKRRKEEERIVNPIPTKQTGNGIDSSLEQKIQDKINSYRSKGILKDRKIESTSWLVYDLNSNDMLASHNIDNPKQLASQQKILVMAAYYTQLANKKITYRKKEREKMITMMTNRPSVGASNQATNYFMDRLSGPESVEKILKKYHPSIFKNIHIETSLLSEVKS